MGSHDRNGEGFRVPSGVRKPLMQEPAVGIYSLSYGVFWIVASSGRPIAATVASPGASRVGLADILLRIFGVKESAFAALNALAIGTGTDLPVGLLCFE
jgi:hypothetical protein